MRRGSVCWLGQGKDADVRKEVRVVREAKEALSRESDLPLLVDGGPGWPVLTDSVDLET